MILIMASRWGRKVHLTTAPGLQEPLDDLSERQIFLERPDLGPFLGRESDLDMDRFARFRSAAHGPLIWFA
jgi:hypothetical protein